MDDFYIEFSFNFFFFGLYIVWKGDLCVVLFVDNNWYVIGKLNIFFYVIFIFVILFLVFDELFLYYDGKVLMLLMVKMIKDLLCK